MPFPHLFISSFLISFSVAFNSSVSWGGWQSCHLNGGFLLSECWEKPLLTLCVGFNIWFRMTCTMVSAHWGPVYLSRARITRTGQGTCPGPGHQGRGGEQKSASSQAHVHGDLVTPKPDMTGTLKTWFVTNLSWNGRHLGLLVNGRPRVPSAEHNLETDYCHIFSPNFILLFF